MDLEEDLEVDLEADEEFSLHNPRFRGDTSNLRIMAKPYFDREWHPYDLYVKAKTEVRIYFIKLSCNGVCVCIMPI
jgi:hypothetical protein